VTNGLSHPELRGEMVDAVELLFRAGVMSHSGHANFSCRLDGERMLLTYGVIVRDLRPEGLGVVTFEGQGPCRYETLYRFGGQVGEVPLARWSPERRDPAFLGSIADAIHGQPGTRAVLLANHGLLAFAASPTAAALLVIALEEAAEAEIAAAAIGGARDFPEPVGP
jgi:L-ribulose-5-phosphate 4-epimerase